jgi:thioredoxin 1
MAIRVVVSSPLAALRLFLLLTLRTGCLDMASDAVMNFTDDTWEQEVLQSDVPVLVDFWAEWCQPCKMLGPTIDELAADYEGKAKIGKMNIDDHKQVAVQMNVQSIPTVMVFKGGQMVKNLVGINAKNVYAEAIDAVM